MTAMFLICFFLLLFRCVMLYRISSVQLSVVVLVLFLFIRLTHHVRQDRDYVEKSGKNRGIQREQGIKVVKRKKTRQRDFKRISEKRKTMRMSK